MQRLWNELGWTSLTQPDQINTTTKKHMTKDESRAKRKQAKRSRKINRR